MTSDLSRIACGIDRDASSGRAACGSAFRKMACGSSRSSPQGELFPAVQGHRRTLQFCPSGPGSRQGHGASRTPDNTHSGQPHHEGAGTSSRAQWECQTCGGIFEYADDATPNFCPYCRSQRLIKCHSGIHEGPLPKGGEGMRVSGQERWCSLTHKAAHNQTRKGCGASQREYTPHQPPAPLSRGARKCAPHLSVQSAGTGSNAGYRTRARRHQRELLASRLRRESGGGTPTARAEVQGSAPIVQGRGRRPTLNLREAHPERSESLKVHATAQTRPNLPGRRPLPPQTKRLTGVTGGESAAHSSVGTDALGARDAAHLAATPFKPNEVQVRRSASSQSLAARAVNIPGTAGASHRALQFSSGDRLAIHQPRSIVGRARDRVKGPAVTRFISAKAVRQGWMASAPFKTAFINVHQRACRVDQRCSFGLAPHLAEFSSGERTDEALAREVTGERSLPVLQAGMGSERSSLIRNHARITRHDQQGTQSLRTGNRRSAGTARGDASARQCHAQIRGRARAVRRSIRQRSLCGVEAARLALITRCLRPCHCVGRVA